MTIAAAILALGALIAALLALAVTAIHHQPTPRRVGFEVRYEHKPVRAK